MTQPHRQPPDCPDHPRAPMADCHTCNPPPSERQPVRTSLTLRPEVHAWLKDRAAITSNRTGRKASVHKLITDLLDRAFDEYLKQQARDAVRDARKAGGNG